MTSEESRLRDRLLARREQLAALTESQREERLAILVEEVEAAIALFDGGQWPLCTICDGPISVERLESDPLTRICLDCLAPDARRALERDLEAASAVQRALLPPTPATVDGWEVAYLWRPLGAVSGDHVDLLRPAAPGQPFHLVVGDVAGKGVAASLLQAHLHALFRALTSAELPLGELVARANRLFVEATAAASYATLTALRVHGDGRIESVNAGHPRPLFAGGRGVHPVEGAGVPFGLFCGADYAVHELTMAPGQTLLLYSDGWTEAEHDGEEYGIGRAAAAFRRVAHAPLPELLAECRADVERHLAGSPRLDDLTLVALRRLAS